MTALGIPAAACVFVSTLFIVVMPMFAGYPAGGDDMKGPAIFGGLSLVLLVVAWRAYVRIKRDPNAASTSPLLTRAVPYLMIAGAVGGVAIGVALGKATVHAMEDRVENLCQLAVDQRSDLLPTCRAQGARCLIEGKKFGEAHANEPFSYDTTSHIHSRAQQHAVECVRTALKL
ncbi:MAG TPA: hypothetical protein VGM39_26365 [Kofleriaceae bacterium]|jgi:hypothetical protein